MKPVALKYCPRCGSIGYQYRDKKYWYCPVCLFTYFHNVATSASVVIEVEGSILMLLRNRDPGAGMLCLPGGFVDPGERAEDAAIRECVEETGIKPERLVFLGTWPNEYQFKDVKYMTCDLFFGARLPGTLEQFRADCDEVSGYQLVSLSEIDTAPIVFDSHRLAIRSWLQQKGQQLLLPL